MARTAKKEKALTPEEKLAQALVPDVAQPYRVPENWCWVKLSSLIDLVSGRDAALSDCNDDGVGIPYILGASNLDNNSFAVERWIEKPQVISQKGDILLSVKGTIGKLYIQQEDAINISRQIMAIRPCAVISTQYTYLFLLSTCEELKSAGNGLIPGISRKNILDKAFPLAPLAEQQRVVDRIESLFAKLDEAKEKAQTVVDGFEDRKSTILHKAFSGELTAEWRRLKNMPLEGWLQQSLKECCNIGSGGTPSRKNLEYYDGDIPWIKTGEIDWNDIYDSEEHISQTAVDNSSAKVYPPGAVLVAMYGMGITRGRAAILKAEATTNQAVCVLQPKEYLLNRYLYYYFMCNYWDIREQAVGGNQLNLSGTIISKFIIGIPCIDEQIKIIRILDSLLGKEQQAKEAAEQVIDQIDSMKKSILARAFRGELGTNDPADESASELLKRVL